MWFMSEQEPDKPANTRNKEPPLHSQWVNVPRDRKKYSRDNMLSPRGGVCTYHSIVLSMVWFSQRINTFGIFLSARVREQTARIIIYKGMYKKPHANPLSGAFPYLSLISGFTSAV